MKNFWFSEFIRHTLQLKFSYIRGRPMITARAWKPKCRARYFELLVDSGADYTLLSKSYALLLGRKGVFDYFDVHFKERAGEVIFSN